MKVLILGASGIIGQHMRLCVPFGVSAVFYSRSSSAGAETLDLATDDTLGMALMRKAPDVVVNLAGESNTDKVEADPKAASRVNVEVPEYLARMSRRLRYRLIQVSTQAVFSGDSAPYGPNSPTAPANEYGRQKLAAEKAALELTENSVVVRPTFVLGVRPNSEIGRSNPIEQMLSGQPKQVSDRWFSVSFAPDVASLIWSAALGRLMGRVVHAGIPIRTSRYEIARDLRLRVEPVNHDDFPGLAPRPRDTTYMDSYHGMSYEDGLRDCLRRWEMRKVAA